MNFTSLAKSEIFIPEFNGNKELPEAQQIKATIIRPTLAERDQIHNKRNDNEIWSAYVRVCLTNLTNITEDDKPLDNGVKLLGSSNPELLGLMYEIGTKCIIFSGLNDKKKD